MGYFQSNKITKLFFLLILPFFILRIPTYFGDHGNFSRFDITNIKNLILLSVDIALLFVFFFLILIQIIHFFKHRTISKSIILVIYPITGVIGYHMNGYENLYQESILFHHFITLTTFFLFFSFIQSNKLFDYKFKELCLKIILSIIFIYFLSFVLPSIVVKLYLGQDLRYSFVTSLKIYSKEITLKQNINGQTKLIFILFVFVMLLFKKFYSNKKTVSYLFFLIGLFLISLVYLTQSRLNIFASFLFAIFFIISIKDLTLKNKLSFLILIITIPILVFNFTKNIPNRFSDQYRIVAAKDMSKNKEKIAELDAYRNLIILNTVTKYKFDPNFVDKIKDDNVLWKGEEANEANINKFNPNFVDKIKDAKTNPNFVDKVKDANKGAKTNPKFVEKIKDANKDAKTNPNFVDKIKDDKINVSETTGYNDDKINVSETTGYNDDKINVWYLNRDYGGNFYFIGIDTNGDNVPDKFIPNLDILNEKLFNKDNEINYSVYIDQSRYYHEIVRVIKEKRSPYEISKLYKDTLKRIVSYNTNAVLSKCLKTLVIFDSILSGRLCGWQILYDAMQKRDLIFGNGFFADQIHLKPIEKVASNSFVNILFNTGLISLLIFIAVILIFFIKYFKFKNLNHTNIYISISHYYFIYFIFRSFFEDMLAFVSIDLLLLGVVSVLIKHNSQSASN